MGNDGYGNTKLYASAEHGATGDDDDNDDEDDDDDDEDCNAKLCASMATG